MIDSNVARVMREDKTRTTIRVELGILVDEGLLEMGVDGNGEAIYWPTPKGCVVLGMESEPESSLSA